MQVTGHVLRSRHLYLRKAGSEARARVLEALGPEARELMETNPLETQWYPYDVYIEISEVIDRVLGDGDMRLFEELGAFSCEQTLTGVFRVFFRFGNLRFLLDRASKAWHSQYDFGSMHVEHDPDDRQIVKLTIRDVPNPHIVHYLAIRGWMLKAAELTATEIETVWESFNPAPGAPMVFVFRYY